MGVLLQLMALPAACMLVAWLRGAGMQAVAAILRGAVAPAAIARPTFARISQRPPPRAFDVPGPLPRIRRAKHGPDARPSSSGRGGWA